MPGFFENNNDVPVKDTFTNMVYLSKHAAGVALAASEGLDANLESIWNVIQYRYPKRFVDPYSGEVIQLEGAPPWWDKECE
jgi:hypothetical protein